MRGCNPLASINAAHTSMYYLIYVIIHLSSHSNMRNYQTGWVPFGLPAKKKEKNKKNKIKTGKTGSSIFDDHKAIPCDRFWTYLLRRRSLDLHCYYHLPTILFSCLCKIIRYPNRLCDPHYSYYRLWSLLNGPTIKFQWIRHAN